MNIIKETIIYIKWFRPIKSDTYIFNFTVNFITLFASPVYIISPLSFIAPPTLVCISFSIDYVLSHLCLRLLNIRFLSKVSKRIGEESATSKES